MTKPVSGERCDMHRVEVREIRPDGWVRVGALEAVEGTPILDIKPALQ
ncbi:MAG: hypothetical protein H5T66_11030 [Chloroflexi bacterium]|nr:hypothetical protein [Chloroflexota bacterium]